MGRFGQEDMRDALLLVHLASSLNGSEPFPEPVLETIGRLVRSDAVSYEEREILSHRVLAVTVAPAAVPSPTVAAAVATFCHQHPLSIERHSSERRVLKISDFVSSTELHRLDYYDQALRPVGVGYQLRLWLPAPRGIARYFSFNRSRATGDFTERDRELLELLRPFLVLRRERFAPPLVVEPDANGLTGREAEILTWVARGKTNKEIALLLLVSPHTVRKHLEHAYEKLGVHTRTAAVARATVLSTG